MAVFRYQFKASLYAGVRRPLSVAVEFPLLRLSGKFVYVSVKNQDIFGSFFGEGRLIFVVCYAAY